MRRPIERITPLTVTGITNSFLLLVFEAKNSIADKQFGGNSSTKNRSFSGGIPPSLKTGRGRKRKQKAS